MSSRHTGITKDRYMMIDDVFRDLKITVVPTNIKKFLTAEINISNDVLRATKNLMRGRGQASTIQKKSRFSPTFVKKKSLRNKYCM